MGEEVDDGPVACLEESLCPCLSFGGKVFRVGILDGGGERRGFVARDLEGV